MEPCLRPRRISWFSAAIVQGCTYRLAARFSMAWDDRKHHNWRVEDFMEHLECEVGRSGPRSGPWNVNDSFCVLIGTVGKLFWWRRRLGLKMRICGCVVFMYVELVFSGFVKDIVVLTMGLDVCMYLGINWDAKNCTKWFFMFQLMLIDDMFW